MSISVNLPSPGWKAAGSNVFSVVNRCFEIVQSRTVQDWRDVSDIIVAPDIGGFGWNGFCHPTGEFSRGRRHCRL
jgi:hypothetical protein